MNRLLTIILAIIVTNVFVYARSHTSLVKALKKNAEPFSRVEDKKTDDDIIFMQQRNSNISLSTAHAVKSEKIIRLAKQELGKKYVWGAVGKKGAFDCSGLTKYVYQKNGIRLPRTSLNQSKYGKYVARNQLQPGDLIFFDTSKERKGYVNHVGIYIGQGKFLHASSAYKKVVISKLDKTFYGKRFKVARRPQS